MPAGQQRRSDVDRAAALAVLVAEGGNVAAAARVTGIAETTIRQWRDGGAAPPLELVDEKRDALAVMFRAEVEAALKQAGSARAGAGYKDLVMGAAIMTDKWQLLTGGPTERSEQTGGAPPYIKVPATRPAREAADGK